MVLSEVLPIVTVWVVVVAAVVAAVAAVVAAKSIQLAMRKMRA